MKIRAMDLNRKQDQEEEEEEQRPDCFDRLPDALLHLIFKKLIDARSLIRCLAVSKRFASLISQTEAVFLAIPRPLLDSRPKSRLTPRRSPANSIGFLLRKFVFTPIRFLRRVVARKSAINAGFGDWYYWPSVALKELKEIKSVHIELPCCGGEIGSNDGGDQLLKWKAEFGSELKSCVVLGASSLRRKAVIPSSSDAKESGEEHVVDEESESDMGEEDLKLRIVWTISSLIAASMRHYLVKQMVADFPMLRSVAITDSTKQGRLCMGEKQLTELRESMKSSTPIQSPVERTAIPDLNMKMWHVPVLDLPASGFVMTAATLVVIRPSAAGDIGLEESGTTGDDFDAEEEENHGAYGEAIKELMKLKRNYALEVNSF